MTAALIFFLLSQISIAMLVDLFSHVNPYGVLLGAVLYLATNVVRASRVAFICRRPLRDVPAILSPTLASSFGNNVLPARAGEPIFIWAAHHRLNMDWGTSTAVMIVMRVFDLLLVALIFVATAMLNGLDSAPVVLQAVSVVLGAGVILTALLPWIGKYFVLALLAVVRLGRSPQLTHFLEREGQRATDAFAQLRALPIYAKVFLSSLVIWAITFVWIFILIRSIGLTVTLDQTIIGSTFGILSKAIPFSSIGGWGAHEVGWAAGFTLTGMPAALAVTSGFAVNTLIILTSAVCGLPAWLALTSERKQETGFIPHPTK